MLNRIRERFGTAGLVVSIMALVLALAGGAFAASGGLNAKQKKQVKAIAKTFAGKPGAPGATGPAGPTGPAGGNGGNGSNGQSVTVTNEPAGANCATGGKKLDSTSGTSYVCNGAAGVIQPGDPVGTANTLPSRATLTGAYQGVSSANELFPGAYAGSAFVSFPVPLTTGLPEANVHIAPHARCTGTYASPKADQGHFCAYPASTDTTYAGVFHPGKTNSGTVTTGASILFMESNPESIAGGTWAVTAP